eukprot:9202457-Lingulodinium_polyedra.AAC.1
MEAGKATADGSGTFLSVTALTAWKSDAGNNRCPEAPIQESGNLETGLAPNHRGHRGVTFCVLRP